MAHILKKEASVHFRYSITLQANAVLFFVRHYCRYRVKIGTK